jgi:RimJ/RimL family protein N-acetyltransferase
MPGMERPSRIIEHEDFTMRQWRVEEDFAPLFQMIDESLEHLLPWMPWAAEHSPEATRGFLDRSGPKWERGDAYNYAITSNDGSLIGSCSVHRIPAPEGREAGYWLHPSATGRGIATRATAALVREAFALPEVEYVEVVHDLANTASGAVPKRLGFREVRRAQVTPPATPGDIGVDVVWRLDRPATAAAGSCR